MSERRLIVLSGEAGSGKDAVAKILIEKFGYEKFELAAEMKTFVQRVFGWSDEQMYGASSARNAPDPKWARPCDNCEGTGYVIDYNGDRDSCAFCVKGKHNDNSPRRVLQLLGDEWARQMIHPDIWTMSSRETIKQKLDAGVKLVVNSARFANDRNNLHEWFGAKRVEVKGSPTKVKKNPDAEWRRHGSERCRPSDDEVEYVLMNEEAWPFHNLEEKVRTMCLGFGYG